MILFIHAKIVYNSTSYSAAPSGSILNLSNSGKTENSASVGPSHSHQLNFLAFAGVRLRSVAFVCVSGAFGCVRLRSGAFGCVRLRSPFSDTPMISGVTVPSTITTTSLMQWPKTRTPESYVTILPSLA